MIKGEKIFVAHVQRKSVQGRSEYTFKTEDGNSIPIGRIRAKGVSIPFTFIKENKMLKTGLDEMLDNPFYQLEISDVKGDLKIGSFWFGEYDQIKNQRMISKQTLFEIMDNVAPGTYTSQTSSPSMAEVMIDTNKLRDNSKTFLENFRIYLTEGVNVFSADTTRGRLAIQLCKNHPKIASNKNEINEGVHEFYIAEEEEGVNEINRKVDTVMEGLQKLGDLFAKYDMFTRYQVAVTLNLVSGEIGDSLVEMNLKNYIWDQKSNKHGSQAERINKFIELFDLLVRDKDRLYVKYLVKQAINERVIVLQGGQHLWPSQKGIDNFYRLGTSLSRIENNMFNDMEAYDPDVSNEENMYYRFVEDLKNKNVKCK
jgi:hypothetical protein